MAIAELGGVRLHYRIDGAEPAPWLVLCNSLGTALEMWDAQIPVLSRHFRVLRYDRRGHGRSSVPPGAYTAADLGLDVIGLMDVLGIAHSDFCGLSIGGITGQWLALHRPERFRRMALCSTGARIGTAQGWQARIDEVRSQGMKVIAAASVARWFTPAYAVTHGEVVAAVRRQLETTPAEGYIGCIGALIGADFRESLDAIRLPVLTIAGRGDPVTPPESLRFISERVAGARQVEVAGAHLCNIESAETFTAALLEFLKD